MDITLVYTIIGFGLAGYSVIANDSIQTLGTFIASKKKWFAWYILAGSASLVMIFALAWGWYNYDGEEKPYRHYHITFRHHDQVTVFTKAHNLLTDKEGCEMQWG